MSRVYIADDHNIVAKGIGEIISKIPEVEEVKIFQNGKELFDSCCEKLPAIVFLDMGMPVWDGKTTLIELKKKFPDLRCMILSMYNEKEIINDCIRKGASGYLNKDCSEEELRQAVLLKDGVYFSKEVLKTLSGFGDEAKNEVFSLKEQLSEREMEVLTLLCEGMTPKEIADKIFLSHRTVETHKTSVMNKLGVNSVGKLISIALKNKIVG
jgi:DNA-binding NarL/FixJ family response regulator